MNEIHEYKQFASEFDKVMQYNNFNEARQSKEQFCKILIDLAMVQQAKLNIQYYIEFVSSLPKVTLLWTILTKVNQKQITKVKRGDIFTILAAVLNLQVQDMLNTTDQKVINTQNPLLYRNEEEEIVFVNYDDLHKFSIKFNSFRDNYSKHTDIRAANIEELKKKYQDTQTNKLVNGLETELQRIKGAKIQPTQKKPSQSRQSATFDQ